MGAGALDTKGPVVPELGAAREQPDGGELIVGPTVELA